MRAVYAALFRTLLVVCAVHFSMPAWSQGTTDQQYGGGSPAELELRLFGKFLRVGETPNKRDFHDVSLAIVSAGYQTTGQYQQVLRLCQYGEWVATTPEQRASQRQCQRYALMNLGRYSEAEVLALEDRQLVAPDTVTDPLARIQSWNWLANLNLNLGQTRIAEAAFRRVIDWVHEARRSEAAGLMEPGTDAALAAEIRDLRNDMLRDLEITALSRLADIAYYQQDYTASDRTSEALLSAISPENSNNLWAINAIGYALRLKERGNGRLAADLARRALPYLKADAGFKNQVEPLHDFRPAPAATAVLGDERTQPLFVESWIRLANAYALLDRFDEANRLLDATEQIARRYLLEPESGNTVIALAEEARADLAAMRQQWKAAEAVLRSVRQRLITATSRERTLEAGRRQTRVDNPLLRVNAKLLNAMVENGAITVSIPGGNGGEVASIAQDFAVSRAALSAQLATQARRANDEQVRALQYREGQLIDELVELRGRISASLRLSKGVAPEAGVDEAVARLNSINVELADIKKRLQARGVAAELTEPSEFNAFRSSMGARTAYWQWITHANGNFVVCWTQDGIHIAKLQTEFKPMQERVQRLRSHGDLRQVQQLRDLKPYPLSDAAQLYEQLFGTLQQFAAGTDHWILANSALVEGIPWGALVTKLSNSNDSPIWLIDRAALTVTPSWRTWLSLYNKPAAKRGRKVLLIGDPNNEQRIVPLSQLSTRGLFVASVTAQTSVSLPQDSAFSKEIETLSRLFPANDRTVLLRNKATKTALMRLRLDEYKLLVFSTHGYLARQFIATIGPSLELTAPTGKVAERFLTAADIARLRLNADLVILSACDTSAPDGYSDSEAFSGLTSAFLLAGARGVIATLWPVETNATQSLITKTVSQYTHNGSDGMAFALQRATQDYLRSSAPEWRHPAFWSAFLLVGR